jgi:hypothetical protein
MNERSGDLRYSRLRNDEALPIAYCATVRSGSFVLTRPIPIGQNGTGARFPIKHVCLRLRGCGTRAAMMGFCGLTCTRGNMAMWFNDKYISRLEHEEAVAIYQTQVAELQRRLREQQAELDAHNLQSLIDIGHRRMDREVRRVSTAVTECGDNIIRFDLQRYRERPSRSPQSPDR